jgi:hypothetical protein
VPAAGVDADVEKPRVEPCALAGDDDVAGERQAYSRADGRSGDGRDRRHRRVGEGKETRVGLAQRVLPAQQVIQRPAGAEHRWLRRQNHRLYPGGQRLPHGTCERVGKLLAERVASAGVSEGNHRDPFVDVQPDLGGHIAADDVGHVRPCLPPYRPCLPPYRPCLPPYRPLAYCT